MSVDKFCQPCFLFFFETVCILYCRCTGISFHLKFIKKMSKCEAILELHHAGRSNPKIVKLTKALKSAVRDTVNCYLELGTSKDCPRCGRPQSAHTVKNTRAVKERIRRNSKQSMRGIAKEMKINEKSMRTIIKQDLKMSFYKIRKHQLLTNLQKQKRRERAQLLLNQLKGGMEVGKIIFSDEKLFTIQGQIQLTNAGSWEHDLKTFQIMLEPFTSAKACISHGVSYNL